MAEMKGKKAIVLGGTSGIGLETAKMLRDAGVEVVVASRRESEIEGFQCETADVLDRDSLQQLFERHTGFDFLVNSATGGPRAIGPFKEMDLDAFQASFAKLWGYTNSVRLAVPHMKENGSIVLFSGYPARKWRPGVLAIGTVGNAVEGFIKLAANEIRPIRINGVCPGLIDTPMFQMKGEDRDNHFRGTTESHLISRAGLPEEVAPAALFLLENDFVTGSIVDVDGGAILS